MSAALCAALADVERVAAADDAGAVAVLALRIGAIVTDAPPPLLAELQQARSILDRALVRLADERGCLRIPLRGGDGEILAAANALLQRGAAIYALGDIPRVNDEVTLKLSRPLLRSVGGAT